MPINYFTKLEAYINCKPEWVATQLAAAKVDPVIMPDYLHKRYPNQCQIILSEYAKLSR